MALPDALIEWSFDEESGVATDYSGNGRDLTISGVTVRTPDGQGRPGRALTQTTSGIAVGPDVNPLETPQRTILFDILISSTELTAWALEFYRSAADTGVWGFLFLSNNLRFRAKNSSNTAFDVTGIPLDAGNWHHLAATHDGSTVKVYRDGALFGSVAMSSAVWDADIFRVFDQTGSAVKIDNVRVYDQALTEAQVVEAMNTPVGAAPEEHPASAGLTGSGLLTITAAPAIVGELDLAGSGSLAGSGAPAIDAELHLAGAGALGAAGSPAVDAAVQLAGAGNLTILDGRMPGPGEVLTLTSSIEPGRFAASVEAGALKAVIE